MLDSASRNIGFDFGFYLGGQMANQMNEPMAKLKIYVVVLLDDYAEEFHEVLLVSMSLLFTWTNFQSSPFTGVSIFKVCFPLKTSLYDLNNKGKQEKLKYPADIWQRDPHCRIKGRAEGSC